ncbi:MAG TPA: type II secretion system F family protein [Telluria sp.]|jgi:tight adherence protein C
MQSLLLQHGTAVIAFFAVLMGMAAALVAWIVTRTVAEVPPEDRAYKDPPPLGFRLAALPIHWLGHFLAPTISGKNHAKMQAGLRQAGLEYQITVPQFVAGRLMCALLVVAIVCWGLASFDTDGAEPSRFGTRVYALASMVAALAGYFYPSIWLRDRLGARRKELLRALPFYLDVITLCVEAGLNMQGAMNQAVAKGPKGVLRDEIQRVLRDIRAGKGRADSLRAMSDRLNEAPVTSFTTAVIQAESMGMNLGPILRAQADQRRSERFLRAEKLAMEAPVKMLFPLIVFIFPCTFIVLFFPIVMKFMHAGI